MIHDQDQIDNRLRALLANGSSLEDAIRCLHFDDNQGLLWLVHAAVNVAGLERRAAQSLVVRAVASPGNGGEQKMDMKLRFRNLHCVCGYFHQDWHLDDPTAVAVVHRYVRDADPEEVERAAAEIDALLRIGMTEEELRAVLDGLDCSYYPPGDGLSYAEWLRQVHDLLSGKR